MFWGPTNQDFNIRLVGVKNEKYNGLLAGVSFPPSSRAPRVSLGPKTPFPFLFKCLPRRLDRKGIKGREDSERRGAEGDYSREAILSNISIKGGD